MTYDTVYHTHIYDTDVYDTDIYHSVVYDLVHDSVYPTDVYSIWYCLWHTVTDFFHHPKTMSLLTSKLSELLT